MKTTAERSSQTDVTIKPIFCQHLAVYEYARQFVKDKVVLDAGCGEGYGTYLLAKSAKKVVGIDYSKEAIIKARRNYAYPNLEFIRANLNQHFFKDTYFDLVCAFQLIEHLPKPKVFLSNILKLLSPEGIFLLSTPNIKASIVKHPYHFREYTSGELERLLKKYFLKVDLFSLQFSPKVKQFREIRAKESSAVLKKDFLGLHRFLPRSVKKIIFDYVARRLSYKIYINHKELLESITTADFWLSKDNLDSGIDLIAICHKTGS
jgi:2-polyprenyl-3-methyl-5-hydroxy-6-metoxy-1,4-benzoquinol methylase